SHDKGLRRPANGLLKSGMRVAFQPNVKQPCHSDFRRSKMTLFTPRLLITDDDRDFRETLAGVLADRGFETLQAGDGEEALKIVCRHEVHLLLLDMQMPRLNGLDTIERMRGVGWTAPTTSVDETKERWAQANLRFPTWVSI